MRTALHELHVAGVLQENIEVCVWSHQQKKQQQKENYLRRSHQRQHNQQCYQQQQKQQQPQLQPQLKERHSRTSSQGQNELHTKVQQHVVHLQQLISRSQRNRKVSHGSTTSSSSVYLCDTTGEVVDIWLSCAEVVALCGSMIP